MSATRFAVSTALALAAAVALGAPAQAQPAGPVKIGEINSYRTFPAFLEPYKKGWELAIEEINAQGGVLGGRKLEVIFRDDNGSPGDAVRMAEELVAREKVALIAGAFASPNGLALSDFAKQKKVLYLASEPLTDKLVWEKGNAYTFRLRASTYMQTAMLVPDAAKLARKRWAIVIPNYEYGTSAAEAFKKLLKQAQPNVEFIIEQTPPLNKIDAGAVVQALADAKPDAIFSALFGADMAKFVREGTTRGLFKDVAVFNLLGGEPEYLDPLKDEAPHGWYVTGYPWDQIGAPEHKKFLDAYRAKFNDYPRVGSVVGYSTAMTIAALFQKAGTLDTEKLVEAMAGLEVGTPFGKIKFRAADHQSTMGAFVGRIELRNGKGVMVDWSYADGAQFLPSEEEAKKLRTEQ